VIEASEKKTWQMRWTEWVWLRALVVGGGMGLILGLVTYLVAPGLFQGFEAGLFDMRVRFANEVQDPPDQDTGVFIIAIDNRSIDSDRGYGPFRQWPREMHGRLAALLARAGASAIFFDLLIAEEDKDPEVDRRLARQLGDWERVAEVENAGQTLRALNGQYQLVLGTNASDSDASDTREALHRVGLDTLFDLVLTASELDPVTGEFSLSRELAVPATDARSQSVDIEL